MLLPVAAVVSRAYIYGVWFIHLPGMVRTRAWYGSYSLAFSEIEHGLVAHVEQQVEDAKVGLKAMTAGKHLVIGLGREREVGPGMLGMDGKAQVVDVLSGGETVGWRKNFDVGADVKQFANLARDGHVKVEKALPVVLFEEHSQVVGIVKKERTVAVSRAECLPMNVAPVAMLRDHPAPFSPLSSPLFPCFMPLGVHFSALAVHGSSRTNGYGEPLKAVGTGYDAAVLVALLLERYATVDQHPVVSAELLIPLYGTKVGGRELNGGHRRRGKMR